MQSKGAIKLFAILLVIASIYELSFSFVTRSVESDAKEYAAKFEENLRADKEQFYLDSIGDSVVYNLGVVKYTYNECKKKELNLGLDLKGGMNVTLTIDVQDLVRALATDEAKNSKEFEAAIQSAVKSVDTGEAEFVDAFVAAYAQNGGSLVKAFSKPGRSDVGTDEKVTKFLKKQSEDAVKASMNILTTRIDRFGVVQPNIQELGNGRIQVELPGIKDPERVRDLLQASASLEFWNCHKKENISGVLDNINRKISTIDLDAEAVEATEPVAEEVEATEVAEGAEATEAVEATEVAPLKHSFYSLVDTLYSTYGIVGAATESDMEILDKYLADPRVKELIPDNLHFMWSVKPEEWAGNRYMLYALRSIDGKPALDGEAVDRSRAEYSDRGTSAEVHLVMTTDGAAEWARITKQLAEDPDARNYENGLPLAIVMDKRVYSAPGVKAEIKGGNSVISGNFTIGEAEVLANVLNSGKVPAPARIIQDTVVGPSLGQESINAGLLSFALAFLLVLLYMGLFYKTAGWIADIALLLNVLFLMGILVSFGAVLTLPGIAGIVLTMGMAVDANVIIYERIKEELRGGKGISTAIKDGFSNAYSAIIDGNLTTIITGVVLFLCSKFMMGGGPVLGFATTLVIGILTSLFTAIFITRLFLDWIVAKRGKVSFSRSWSENWLANTKFDFIGKRKYSYIISGLVIVASVISLCFHGLNTGVDFTGGRSYQVRFDNTDISIDEIRQKLEQTLVSDDAASSSVEVKQFGEDNQIRITTQYKHEDTSEATTKEVDGLIYEALKEFYKEPISLEEFTSTQDNPNGIVSSEKIGPAIANEMVQGALWAILISLVAIGLYIVLRFKRWQWALGATFALAHNAFVVIGIFSMLYSFMPFNLEVNQAFIAAILTIIGYSINDTVVIFDRIREYLALYPKRNIRANINSAINSTLSRTMNTSGTTIVTLLAIFIFGGENLRGFVFALLLGVIIGTYSSVFIATPIAYDILGKKNNKEE
ncbi:MAG: protein translocase subunit SecDF [Alistipes sp.]|nr:protein translocase subunit SecDF [Alistipes sp.]